jgi:hypothetical protein
MNLKDKLDRVSDRNSFLEFVKALIEDWNENEKKIEEKKKQNLYSPTWDDSEWQNGTIGSYLEAATAWAEAFRENRLNESSWKSFAEFLYAGKIYE